MDRLEKKFKEVNGPCCEWTSEGVHVDCMNDLCLFPQRSLEKGDIERAPRALPKRSVGIMDREELFGCGTMSKNYT